MKTSRISRIEWGCLEGTRPRLAGSNARLNAHGDHIRVPLARLTTEDGSSGFGACRVNREQAQTLLGLDFNEVWQPEAGASEAWRAFDYPLWELAGQRCGQPVYALAAQLTGAPPSTDLQAPCYDTSLYFDDLHLSSDVEAAALMVAEAQEGWERGHRAFKLKVGRGARHMELEAGTQRDIAIIRAVREALGIDAVLLLDANNGYNLNLTKRVLEETADCNIFWMEEPFHEDNVLLRDLKAWMAERGLSTLVAEGEGWACPALLDWAREGLIDVVQYDIFGHGFTRWLHLGKQLGEWDVRAAPHHYGGHFGNYAACHFAAAIKGFTFVEWDECRTPGLDGSTYAIYEGCVQVPCRPGFGLELEEETFRQAVQQNGFELSL